MDLIGKLVKVGLLNRGEGFNEEIFREEFERHYPGVEISSFPSDIETGLYRIGMFFLRDYIKEDLITESTNGVMDDEMVVLARIGAGLVRNDEKKIAVDPPIDELIRMNEPGVGEISVSAFIQKIAIDYIKVIGKDRPPHELIAKHLQSDDEDIPF